MEWNENDHPRDEGGKFTDGGAKEYRQNTGYNQILDDTQVNAAEAGREVESDSVAVEKEKSSSLGELNEILGEEFTGYKGQAAVDKLLKERHGHVKAAFHRDDIGDIDLLWGTETLGLQHIIARREEQGISTQEFLGDNANVVENGEFARKNSNGTFEFWSKGKMAVISPEYHGNRITFLLTAYKRRKK